MLLCFMARKKFTHKLQRADMKIYAVNCDKGRADRLLTAAAPLDLDIVLVPSPQKDDPEVVRRGRTCFERNTSYPTGLAATLGHLRAMELIAASPDRWGIIIEDDVRFRKDFKDVVARLESLCDVDIVSLGFVNFPVGTPHVYNGVPLIPFVSLSNPWGAQCYMITRTYAAHLVSLFQVDDVSGPYGGPFVTDWVLFDPVLGCRRHTVVHPIAVEGPEEQTIAGSTNKPDLWPHLNASLFCL